ncbi:MAG TPA: sporulation peptidase YabG [Clostridiales bacterium]|nr:sporulation peptidase YabG [Clostridiales bacterium]
MGNVKVGDIVARNSYGCDIFFKVVEIKSDGKQNIITLKGITYRIQADAPESDLIVQSDANVREYRNKVDTEAYRKLKQTEYYSGRMGNRVAWPKKGFHRDTSNDDTRTFTRPGKILHFDGDEDYLETCIKEYIKRGVDAVGKHIAEKEQPSRIYKLLQEYKPDILVITGHDSISKDQKDYLNINSYVNSRYFIESVKEARRYNPDMDSLVIFAGACQSLYDGIIKAGANFASSPDRVLIHALDPVLVAEKLSLAPIDRVVMPMDVINNTITGATGIGGLQTRGKFRKGYPKEPYTGNI